MENIVLYRGSNNSYRCDIEIHVLETPLFQQILKSQQVSRVPLVELFKKQWLTIIILAISWWYINTLIWSLTSFAQGYITLVNRSIPAYIGPFSGVIVGAVGIVGVIIGAYLGDILGRKKVLVSSAGAAALFSYPYIFLLSQGTIVSLFIGQAIMAFIIHSGYAVLSAFFAEQFPTRYRASGTGFVYHIANPFSGGIAPALSAVFTSIYGPLGAVPYIGAIMIAYSVTSVIAGLFTKETSKVELK
ncbi:hypothetical protein SUSAZ_05405 [Sulfolobus acidocaldarius SUSAZ]|nr:hypothetical protein SUSAZ_05405 [Sulfolobus acidocaldarius SUSAZ]